MENIAESRRSAHSDDHFLKSMPDGSITVVISFNLGSFNLGSFNFRHSIGPDDLPRRAVVV